MTFEIGQTLTFDDPDNTCFGCSPHNEHGLQLTFVRTGPKRIECRTRVKPDFGGQHGVIHGGIQATLLDEVMGVAVRLAYDGDGDGDGDGEDDAPIVTADFSLRYRRPARTEEMVVLVGELEGVEGRNVHVRGEIQSEGGKTLTQATARWVRLEPGD